jgi:hypothetical protein
MPTGAGKEFKKKMRQRCQITYLKIRMRVLIIKTKTKISAASSTRCVFLEDIAYKLYTKVCSTEQTEGYILYIVR